MIRKIVIIFIFVVGILSANSNFGKIVDAFVKQKLEQIPKPPQALELVKDEFETTKEFEARVKKTKINQKKIAKRYKAKIAKAKSSAKKEGIKKALQYFWGKPLLKNLKYDADNGYFVANLSFEAKKDFNKKVAIKVPRKYARGFKKGFNSLKPQAIFDYNGESVSLKDIVIAYKKIKYTAQFTNLNIDDTRVAVNLSNEFNINTSVNTDITIQKAKVSSFDTSGLVDLKKLDRLLAKATKAKKDRKKWLFIVGIEKYEFTDNISYAKRTAVAFRDMAYKVLGVPKENSFVLIDDTATGTQIKTKFKKLLRKVKKGDTVYFYYNGHGVPVVSQKNEPFLLPRDMEVDFVADEKFFSLRNIYSKLSNSKAKKVIAIVDSCFSGLTDSKAIIKGVAATKLRAKRVKFNKNKMVVLSAGKSYQYSNGYSKRGFRLFSYYIIKDIIEGKKSLKNLYKDVKDKVYETSRSEYGDLRVQEPQADGNLGLKL